MQQVWLLLLDEDFMHAYVHGFEFELAEGEQYLGYPRFLSKSQDYPEKWVFLSFTVELSNYKTGFCRHVLNTLHDVPALGV